ncbi:pass1 domain protein [Novosphingobium nitrogenifigens DSM 19370]|uniref:Pass1 domain protein n=1 Tax=Novosphingobium nitrogenifigens DSM 19370 TaxID=983920 RepID=F1Z4S3_9SPHN|nr:cupin-like domain-containing protein [Novosphingobium nitrogenifigens]EGD60390.1 pass1 domain protein [Novosphingobium nitrogenifigens DSM 19370]
MKNVPQFTSVTPDIFLNEIKASGKPAIMKGLVSQWPSVALDEDALLDHLALTASSLPIPHFVCDPVHHGRFFYDEGYTSFNYRQELTPAAEFFARLRREAANPEPAALFAGSLALDGYFPGFAQSHHLDGFIPASQFLRSMWIGNRTMTAPHYDNVENIACVVAGRRKFTLFPIEQLPNLYMGPLDLTPAGQPISLVDIRAPDYERFPRYREAEAHGLVAMLEPGDAIYIPTLWWHGVESLDGVNVMVNTWWRDVPAYLGSPMSALLSGLLTLRDLPEAQRAAWKVVFDTLVFETNGPAFDHLPDAARGVAGRLTRNRAAQLRELILQTLS